MQKAKNKKVTTKKFICPLLFTCWIVRYLSLFALTLLTLLLWPTSGVDFGHHLSDLMASIRLYSSMFKGTKEKTEDEDCEYEMMWDAEGSMHLVKKARDTPLLHPSDKASVERFFTATSSQLFIALNTNSTCSLLCTCYMQMLIEITVFLYDLCLSFSIWCRGNAVMRPTARKNAPRDMEVSMNIDINADTGFDKLSHRTSKSKTKIIIHRLVRTFQMVTVIATVNVPLYMMLLFKDWIDKWW